MSEFLTNVTAAPRQIALSLRQNLGLLGISLALSFVIWAFVINETNPPRADLYPATITVSVRNIPSGLQLMSPTANVQVRVSAPVDAWSGLRPSTFDAFVDLSEANPGVFERDIRVDSADPRVRVLEVIPARVSLRLEAITRKTTPVRPTVEGAAPFGFSYENVALTPNQVVVSGPSSLVDRVDSVVVAVRLEGARASIQQTLPVYAQSAEGSPVNGVKLEPDNVGVNVDIVQQIAFRAVSVSPQTRGATAAGYWVRGLTVDPPVVTLAGDRALLDAITFLRTAPVDLGGAKADFQRAVELELPRGVSLTGPSTVQVSVNVAQQQGTTRVIVLPIVVGLAPDEVALIPPLLEVTLAGDAPLVQNLDPTTVTAALEVSGRGVGVFEITPRIIVPPGLSVAGVSPGRVNVTIRPISAATGLTE